jgi:hypothetical protein
LVDAYEGYNCFGEGSFQNGTEFCVKLKNTTTETFEMLKSAYGEECLLRTGVSEWHKSFKIAQKVRMQKSRVKTTLNAFFEGIHHKFVPEKQSVHGKFYKDVIKRLITRVHSVRPEFQESGSWHLLQNAPVHSSGVVSEFLVK